VRDRAVNKKKIVTNKEREVNKEGEREIEVKCER
jgi:hypothetical protein